MTVWLTIAEAGEYAKLSHDAIRAAIKAGDLPSYSPTTRNVRLKASEVDAWVESKPYIPPRAAS